MEGVVLGFLIVSNFLLLVLIVGIFLLLDRTKHMSQVPAMLATVIQFLNSSPYPDEMMGGPGPIFRSLDGKYTASSLEELISKMQSDPDSGITSADVDQLRNMFNGLTDDMDDDDDDLEEWQKKGK